MTPPTVPEAGPQPVEGSRAQCVACDNELIDGQCPIHGDLTARAQDVPMTPPSSPRTGRSTVSAAGEAREGWIEPVTGDGYAPDQARPTKHAEHDHCYWAGYAEGKREAEAAESRPSVTERPDELLRRMLDNWGDEPCRLDHHGYCQAHMLEDTTEDYCTVKATRDYLAAASPAGPGIRNRLLVSRFDPSVSLDELIGAGSEAVPQSEREGLLRRLVEAWDAMYGKVRFTGTAPDSVDLGLNFDRLMDEARAALASPAHPDEESR
jgi:hypothetical protein